MTFVTYLNNCQSSPPVNGTDGDEEPFSLMSVTLLIFSSIALILEVTAQVVLCHSRGRRFGSLRTSLITLTSIEMWLNSSIFINKTWEEFGMPKYPTLPGFICSFILFSLLNNAICSRNWAVTLIALARCEAITRPVAHRVTSHIFSPTRQLIYISILICFGMILSVLRLLFRSINVCTNLGGVIHYPNRNATQIRIICEKIFFVYQSAIPIALVSLSTAFMIITLLRSSPIVQRNSSSEPKKSDGKIISRVYQQKKKKKSYRLSKQVRATRAILLITAVFVVCEAPIFFAVVLADNISQEAKLTIYKALRFLIVTDTYANFIIYLLTSKHFRHGLQKAFTCRGEDYLLRPNNRGISTKTTMTSHFQLALKDGVTLNASSSVENRSTLW